MQKRSVLFINDSLWNSSGVFRAMLPILRNLPAETFDITLYIAAGATTEPEAQSLLPEHVRLIVGEETGHYYKHPAVFLLHALYLICKILRCKTAADRLLRKTRKTVRAHRCQRQAKVYFGKQAFDAVVANTVPVCAEIAEYINAAKKYAVFHSSKPDFFKEQTERVFEIFTGVIAVGEGVKRMLAERYASNADKIIAITNYVDAAEIRAKAAAYALPEDNFIRLCTCGRLEKEKGFDLALEAAKLLRGRGYEFIWYFVGDGTEKDALTLQATAYGLAGNIVFTGFQPNPYPYIAGCDIYIQPSYEEAQPLTVMEALILGKAVVSTDTVGGNAVLHNGERGVLTPVSGEGLADGIAPLLEDPGKREALMHTFTEEDDLHAKQAFADAWIQLLNT